MREVLRCMVCRCPYSRHPDLQDLDDAELEQLLQLESEKTGHISHGICDGCKDIPPEKWPAVSRIEVVNEVMKPLPEWDQWYRRGSDLCERIARRFPRTRDRIHADDGEVDAIWGGLDDLLTEIQDAKAITEEQKQQITEAERLVEEKEMQMSKEKQGKSETKVSETKVPLTEREHTLEAIRNKAMLLVDHLSAKALENVIETGQESSFRIALRLETTEEGKVEVVSKGRVSMSTAKFVDTLAVDDQIRIPEGAGN